MLKLSFILPCYNVAPYIGRCIESIEHQDIPQSEYEVICVDDCSTDDTVRKIKEYQTKCPNIQLICHTENKTAGGARNTGIDYARGKYIWFVDPDDRIMPNSLKKLWNEVKESQLDILFFNNNMHTYSGECINCNVVGNSEVLSGQDYLVKYFPSQVTKICSVWNELMRTEYVVNSMIRYPEIPASQDVVFLWEVICNAQKVRSIDSIYYSVYQRANSTTGAHGRYTAKSSFSFVVLYPRAMQEMFARNNIRLEIIQDLEIAIHRTINDNSKKLFRMSLQEKRKFYSSLISYKSDIDILAKYVNSMTQRLLKTYHSYLIWLGVIYLSSLYVSVKSRLK